MTLQSAVNVTRVAINFTSSGSPDNETIVAATAGSSIRVFEWIVGTALGATDISWLSDTTMLMGPIEINVRQHMQGNFNPWGSMQTAAGEALVLRVQATGSEVGGYVVYALV